VGVVTVNAPTWAPITDVDEARRIAREWQSSGTIGSVLASFASGRVVDRWRLHDDARATQHESPGMDLSDWADLDRLRDWCKGNADGHLSGPHGEIRVITNHHVREVLRWHDLTAAEQESLGYGTDTDWVEDREFVRFRGDVVDLTDRDGLTPSELRRKGWDSYASDSFFSGLVFKWFDEDGNLIDGGDGVIVGRYVA
jgi:hypothetical protein